MKTTNIVLIGVVGVGAVGAYMYMKNKKAQSGLLSGSLSPNNQGGSTIMGETTPIVKEINLDEVNFNTALNAIKNFVPVKAPHPIFTKKFQELNAQRMAVLTKRFAELGYKFQNGKVVRI